MQSFVWKPGISVSTASLGNSGVIEVVGTTKCSEQNHNPKKKDSNSKNIRGGVKSHDRFLIRSKTGHHVRVGFAAYRRGRLGITLPANYNWL